MHRRTAARLHLVFDLEHLATVGVGANAEERQPLAFAVVDHAGYRASVALVFVVVIVCVSIESSD